MKNYDDNSDGITSFDLTLVNMFCNDDYIDNFTITYYESSADANSGINAISDPTNYVNESNPDRVYVRLEHNTTSYIELGNFGLTVLFAEANSPDDLFSCDDNNDGFQTFDLTNLNSAILGNQNADAFTIFYFLTQSDAETNTALIANPEAFVNTANPQTLFARVQENISGSYAITSFDVGVISVPEINEPMSLEVCDDITNDGIAVFDLSSKTDEIIGDLTNVSVSYHSTESDANNKENPLSLSFTNTSNPQTIYSRVENDITGCYSVTSFDLIVQDCKTKGVIEISAFYDEDENSTFENDEINFLNGVLTYEKNNDGILRNLYSSNGNFSIISGDENDTYDISFNVLGEYDACFSVTTASYENISVTNGSTINYNFPITKVQDCGDIAVYLVSYAPPRPGFDYYNRLVIVNRGIEAVTSGSIEFTHDPLVTLNTVNYVDAGNTVTTTSSGFRLDFVNLEPNQSESVVINMYVPIPTPLGTLLSNTATYSVTDLSSENNESILSEIVIGSYDPNDIAESHGSEILHVDFESTDYLYYTVRFQNVGTADAINVSIDNTLDSRLDKSTIQMLSSSHTNVFTRTDDQLNWQFDNIHLPSEDMDEPNSHGYVYYKIKPTAGYSVGDIVPNTAEIYFDFNPAVITNTFETEFTEETVLSNREYNSVAFSIFPNPANDIVEFKFTNNITNNVNIEIYNIQGKLILNSVNQIKESALQINISALKSGMYFLKVNDGVNESIQKLVIK